MSLSRICILEINKRLPYKFTFQTYISTWIIINKKVNNYYDKLTFLYQFNTCQQPIKKSRFP